MAVKMNVAKVKGLLAERGCSKKQLAKYLNISKIAVYKKLQSKIPFKLVEIEKMCEIFNISINYFFE